MNAKENIDYILLNILKYYQKSGFKDILLTFENTPCDRLLFEIVRRNYDKFDNIYIECSLSAHENLFTSILTDEEKEKITFSNLDDIDIRLNKHYRTKYRLCGKNELYCKSYLKFDYDENDAYPLFGYKDEEIIEMLKYFNIKVESLVEESYGLPLEDLNLLKQYLYDYRNFAEDNDNAQISKFLNYIKRQRSLITKFVIPLADVQQMENFM